MGIVENIRAQASAVPEIDDSICHACTRCVARVACRSKAILQLDPGEPPAIDSSRCYGCQACVPACPFGAIRKVEPHQS